MKTTIRCGRGARLTLCSGTTPESAIAGLGSLWPCQADPTGPCRIGILARDETEERTLIAMALRARHPALIDDHRIFFAERQVNGRVVFMFPGQGSQHAGMFQGLRRALPTLESTLATLAAVHPVCRPVLEMIGTAPNAVSGGELEKTQFAQPALAMICSALATELARFGVVPELAIGHSFGELVALSVVGAISPHDLILLSVERGRLMARAGARDCGAMLAVHGAAEKTTALLADAGIKLALAALNCTSQFVLAGPRTHVEEAQRVLSEYGVRSSQVKTSGAFHSPLMASAQAGFETALRAIDLQRFSPRVVGANATGGWHSGEPDNSRMLLGQQLTQPVRWIDNLQNAYDAGGRIFIEVGPGNVLRSLCRQAFSGSTERVRTLSLERGKEEAEVSWLKALALLGVEGVPVKDPAGAPAERIELRSAGSPIGAKHTSAGGVQEPELAAIYLKEASRQIDAYFRRQVELVTPNADARTVRLALEMNSNVVASFLQCGALVAGLPGGICLAPDGSPVSAPQQPHPVESGKAVDASRQPAGAHSGPEHSRVAALLADMTGYPADMMRADMRLEEDLGLTSISVVELMAVLREEFSGVPAGEALAAKMCGIKTVNDLTDLCTAAVGHDDAALCEVRGALASRTGYPAEQISPGLRLEEDLGIVSIALVELLAEYGIGKVDALDEVALVNIRTVGDLADALRSQRGRHGSAPTLARGPRKVACVPAVRSPGEDSETILRFGFQRVPLSAGGSIPRRVLVACADRRLAEEMRTGLAAAGSSAVVWHVEPTAFVINGERHDADSAFVAEAIAQVFGPEDPAVLFATGRTAETSTDVNLTGLALASLARSVSARWPRGDRARIGVIVPAGGAPEAMTAVGYARALQREWPGASIRAVRVEGSCDGAFDVEKTGVAALCGPSETRIVQETAGRLCRVVHVAMPNGDRPGTSDGTSDSARGLREVNGAVLATGGGDGITAEILVSLAGRLRCPIAVLGRTAFPHGESSGRGQALRRTKARVESAGAEFMYCQADATDPAMVRASVRDVRARFGSVAGLILGAGIMHEARIEKKTRAIEAAVLAAKIEQVNTFRALFEKEALDFALLFSSIVSYTGNVNHADYVAANLAFEELGARWNRAASYPVRSMLWSVWHETGLAPQWLRRQMSGGGPLQGIGNAVGSALVLDELEFIDTGQERVLLAPTSVIRYLMPEENGDG